jgi:hypothetical protein
VLYKNQRGGVIDQTTPPLRRWNMEQKKTQMAKLNIQSKHKGVKKWIAKHDYLNANKGNNHDLY